MSATHDTTGQRIRLTIGDDGVARLRLVRGDAGNAIDPAWVKDLDAAVTGCERATGVRALLICADGPAFTVGGDLNHFGAGLDRLADALDEMIAPFHETLARLTELPVPVVCAVQGSVAGGGLGLLWCSDVVLATPDAKLATGFSRLGLSGDGGSSWWLPRLVGLARARELLVGGRVLTGEEAADWGLVTRTVAKERLAEEALVVARELAAGPTLAYGEMRRMLARSFDVDLRAGLLSELQACIRCGDTADAREGVGAFVERRDPGFAGR